MRFALLSYSHHGRSIAQIVRDLGHDIVGVADAEDDPREQLVRIFGCPGFDTYQECLDATRPDAAIVCGKHVDIPAHILACVEREIPYLVDKPFADCADRLRPVAERSASQGVFSALTLPNRATRLVEQVQHMHAEGSLGDLVLFNSRLCNGAPDRYDATPSWWHNDPSISGGGCWATEAAHGIDTFLQFTEGDPWHVVGATLSNSLHRREVEDSAIGTIRTDSGVTGVIETGYTFPPGGWGGDHFFRFVGTRATVFQAYNEHHEPIIGVHATGGETFFADLGHGDRMRTVIQSALSALEGGRTFAPDITQAVRVLELQDAVYAHARETALTNGPHPMGAPGRD